MSENENMELNQDEITTQESAPKAKKEKKPEKKAEKKPGIFSRIGRWLREMRSELKKVVWPDKKTTAKNTAVVIVCVLVVGVFIWGFDWIANNLISALISLLS